MILYNAVPGGGGTDAAGYKPHDVCVSKLELTSIQGRMLVNGWHRMATERLPVDRLFRATATFLRLKVLG